jgi:hypothetical protein
MLWMVKTTVFAISASTIPHIIGAISYSLKGRLEFSFSIFQYKSTSMDEKRS